MHQNAGSRLLPLTSAACYGEYTSKSTAIPPITVTLSALYYQKQVLKPQIRSRGWIDLAQMLCDNQASWVRFQT